MKLYRGNPQLAGVLLLVFVAVFVLVAVGVNNSFGLPGNWRLGLPPTRDYTLSARFDDANGLTKGAGVVVGGVPIGQVTGVTVAGRRALVTMRIDHRYAPVHRGTIARIRYSTLLAQKYVELSPAKGTPALADGATIPSDQTVTPVDFDQFLSSLDPATRRQAQVLIQQLGGGVEGRGATINLLLDQLSGLTQESQGGLATIDQHDADLGSITSNLAVASNRLARSRQQLGDLVANTDTVTGTLAENDEVLDQLIVHLARTSSDLDQTLNGNEQNLHQTVVTLDPFLTQLDGTLATTYPYLHGQTQEIRDAFNSLIPYIGSAISQRDANGNYLRQYVVLDTCYDLANGTRANPATGQGCALNLSLGGSSPASQATSPGQGASASAHPSSKPAPKPTSCPGLSVPNPVPSALPNPLPSLAPCPANLLPCLPPVLPSPSPSPTASPSPPPGPSPSPSPSPGFCLDPKGVVHQITQSVLPSPLSALLGLP